MQAATGMAELGKMYDITIDPSDWLFHWRVASALFSICGLLGFIIGIAMFLQKRWSLILLATTATCVVLLGLIGTATGYSRYAFGQTRLIPSIVLIALVVMAVVGYRRWNQALCMHPTPNPSLNADAHRRAFSPPAVAG